MQWLSVPLHFWRGISDSCLPSCFSHLRRRQVLHCIRERFPRSLVTKQSIRCTKKHARGRADDPHERGDIDVQNRLFLHRTSSCCAREQRVAGPMEDTMLVMRDSYSAAAASDAPEDAAFTIQCPVSSPAPTPVLNPLQRQPLDSPHRMRSIRLKCFRLFGVRSDGTVES